jgi:hypothetical protein
MSPHGLQWRPVSEGEVEGERRKSSLKHVFDFKGSLSLEKKQGQFTGKRLPRRARSDNLTRLCQPDYDISRGCFFLTKLHFNRVTIG